MESTEYGIARNSDANLYRKGIGPVKKAFTHLG